MMNGAALLGAVLLLLGLGRAVGVLFGFDGVALRWWLACLVGFYLLSVGIAYTSARLDRVIDSALAPQPVQTFEGGPDDPVDSTRWQRVIAATSPAAGRLDASLPAADDTPTAEQVMPRVASCSTCPNRAPFGPAGELPSGWAQVSGVVWCWRCSGGVPS
jgi:hypothetical protein